MKLIFINEEDKRIKTFKSLEDLSNFLEEKALKKYKRTFLKEDGKIFEFVMYRKNKYETVKSYVITLQKNKRILGYVQIPMGLMAMPRDSFTIKVDKSKYKEN